MARAEARGIGNPVASGPLGAWQGARGLDGRGFALFARGERQRSRRVLETWRVYTPGGISATAQWSEARGSSAGRRTATRIAGAARVADVRRRDARRQQREHARGRAAACLPPDRQMRRTFERVCPGNFIGPISPYQALAGPMLTPRGGLVVARCDFGPWRLLCGLSREWGYAYARPRKGGRACLKITFLASVNQGVAVSSRARRRFFGVDPGLDVHGDARSRAIPTRIVRPARPADVAQRS